MIMMGDRKKAVTAILGPDSDNVGSREDESGSEDAMHSVANELIEAVHAKNVPDVVAALKAAHAMCNAPEDDETED